MKRALITTLACVLAAPMTLAETSASAPVTEASQCLSIGQVSGTIMNVDVEKKSFTVVVEEKEVVLSFNADTQFLLDGKKVDAARLLKLGTKVTVAREGDLAKKVEANTKDPQ